MRRPFYHDEAETEEGFVEATAPYFDAAWGLSVEAASMACREYYRRFTDAAALEGLPVPVQDWAFFHHETAGSMAPMVYFYQVLGQPDPNKFIDWRASYYRNSTS